jgi:osmotically-inducible protein OsmY
MLRTILILVGFAMLISCSSPLMTGAQVFYDRQSLHEDISNHQLQVKANHALFDHYPRLRRENNVSIISFNKVILAVGQVKTAEDKELVTRTLSSLKGAVKVYNELTVGANISFVQQLKDSVITGKMRARLLVENGIDPKNFKVVTENGVMYILGDVKKPAANTVVQLAKNISGVQKVVKVFRFYKYIS